MKPHLLLVLAALGVSSAVPASAEVKLVSVQYKHGDDMLEGYLAFDDAKVSAKQPAPGVIVCPEWWGTNEYPKQRAKQLAGLGYVAFAIDMYGLDATGKPVTTDDPNVAKTLSGAVMGDVQYVRARAKAGYDALVARPEVDKKHVAVIGYCMGGAVALELARSGASLEAVITFHASQLSARGDDKTALADNQKIHAFVTICHGLDDGFVPAADVEKFHAQMKAAKVDYQFVGYVGAVHAFTNPEADKYKIPGVAYNAKADARSWELMKSALHEAFTRR
jgi:dienelactone hydrolase